ncbi:MAG: aminotransferase class IV family protein [Acidobacteria bacterium]|nr:aminotransferase class IV family protein [Acidobacteriota bacterium]
MHRFLLHNDAIRETTEPCLSPGQVGFMNGWGVFSTLRVSEGVLFAWERHWARMLRDAGRMHVPMPATPDSLLAGLRTLIAANGAQDGTLRVAIVRNHGGLFEAPGLDRPFETIAFTTSLRDWGGSVSLALKSDARHGANQFRGAKITAWANNLAWYEESHDRGFDEVVLLDEFGRVSECTSANIFAVSGSDVLTPPLDSGCLPGITREVLLDAIHLEGITIREAHLKPADLEAADEVFITSSTRDLLPVAAIEGLNVKQGTAVQSRLLAAFRAYISNYVAARKAVPVV